MYLRQIKQHFKGEFLTEPALLKKKLAGIKAYVYDWDGVFNNGMKNETGSSSFSEVDAMGTNMLRFSHYLQTELLPLTSVISGEKNDIAFTFVKREHFHASYYSVANKADALKHLCHSHNIQPSEIAFFFDDILDLPIASVCGLRFMSGRAANPLFMDYVRKNKLADYITSVDGGHHAVREAAELAMGLRGNYDETISQRVAFSKQYQHYLQVRNNIEPAFYTSAEGSIITQTPQ